MPLLGAFCQPDLQNLTTLALAIPEISLEAANFKMGYVTLTMPLLRVICHPCAWT